MVLTSTTAKQAFAQDLEALVMPGEVIAGHADLETECSSCHKMFDKDGQKVLCLDCHDAVAADFNAQSGFHGMFQDVRDSACSSCHTDHIGRDGDITVLDEAAFDHSFTDFELIGAHLEVACNECHAASTKRRDATSFCNDCHNEDDVHKTTLGEDCSSCHKPTEWKDANFDHDSTGYPLTGKHTTVTCLDCHVDETYQNAPTTCVGCHKADDAHDGRSGDQCESCHNPSDWSDSSFSHERDTTFPLQGKHARLGCADCHSENPFNDQMDTACISCHTEDDSHDGHNGLECNDCHSNDDWAAPTFEHDEDTEYALRGGHRDVICTDCHIEPIFEVALQTYCSSCHLDDDAHDSSLGTQCENCHTEVNWQDPVFFDHDLASFPLLGKHADNECTDCHQNRAFGNVDSNCGNCHQEDDPHRGSFHERCDACHNPVAWDAWTFDHDAQTDFPLSGAHTTVNCNNCHRSPLDKMQLLGVTCRSCHRADDVHDGEFGSDCGRCHSADSFKEIRSLQ